MRNGSDSTKPELVIPKRAVCARNLLSGGSGSDVCIEIQNLWSVRDKPCVIFRSIDVERHKWIIHG